MATGTRSISEVEHAAIQEDRMKVTYDIKEVPQSSIEKTLTTYQFILSDYNRGLNYGVSKETINICLTSIEEIIKKPLQKAETRMSTEDYLTMIYPLLEQAWRKQK